MTMKITALLLAEGKRPAEMTELSSAAGVTPEQKPRRALTGATGGLILIHVRGPRRGAFALQFYPGPWKKDYRLQVQWV